GRDSERISTEPITKQPIDNSQPAQMNLTQEQAVQVVASFVQIPTDAKLDNASYNEYTDSETGKKRSNWNINWSLTAKNGDTGSIWASVNAETGELESYYNYMNSPVVQDQSSANTQPQVSIDQAKNKAIEFVNKT